MTSPVDHFLKTRALRMWCVYVTLCFLRPPQPCDSNSWFFFRNVQMASCLRGRSVTLGTLEDDMGAREVEKHTALCFGLLLIETL